MSAFGGKADIGLTLCNVHPSRRVFPVHSNFFLFINLRVTDSRVGTKGHDRNGVRNGKRKCRPLY
jgi:hypothetical protein